jgi:hypothetical protein
MVMLLNIKIYERSNMTVFWKRVFVVIFVLYGLYYLYNLWVALKLNFRDISAVNFDNYINELNLID